MPPFLLKFDIIFIELNNINTGQEYKKAIKTNIKYPDGYKLVSKSVNVGTFEYDISSNVHALDTVYVNVGVSKDGYIQYSIAESSHTENGHILCLIFINKQLISNSYNFNII